MESLAARPLAALAPGSRLGRYELLHALAVGGMAELHLARQSGIEGFEKIVVLKRVRPHLANDPEFVRMLMAEARMCAALDHPNIAQVLDIGECDGVCFFAMEYVHGRDLRAVLHRGDEHPLSLADALTVLVGVASGLHHAHELLGPDGRPLGLVHRDVSPSNVMIGYSGAIKLTDFGIARAAARTSTTLAGQLKGKIGYMSPEQCRGDAVDRRSDVFALGILLYECTTGVRAFHADNDFAVMGRIARGDVVPPREIDPGYPQVLSAIVERALAVEPEDRYPTARAMQAALERAALELGLSLSTAELAKHMQHVFGSPAHPQSSLHELGPAAQPTTVRIPSHARRNVVLLAAGSATLLAGLALWSFSEPSDARATERDASSSNETVIERDEENPTPAEQPDVAVEMRAVMPEPTEPPSDEAVVVSEPPSRAARPSRRKVRATKRRNVDHNALYPPGLEP